MDCIKKCNGSLYKLKNVRNYKSEHNRFFWIYYNLAYIEDYWNFFFCILSKNKYNDDFKVFTFGP